MANYLISLLLFLLFLSIFSAEEIRWSGKSFPDIRGKSSALCGGPSSGTKKYLPYVCDPDHLLNRTEIQMLNTRLHKLANNTPCNCQRPSQCTTDDAYGKPFFHGFVVAIALVKKIELTIYVPNEKDKNDRAELFSRVLQGRWALGDCGNSAIILVWQEYGKIYISTGRVTGQYLTKREIEVIISQAQQYIEKSSYAKALMHILENIQMELNGEPEGKLDIGTLSLILAVAIALLFVCVITGCVCAFRCCGNMHPDSATPLGRTIERMDSFKAEIVRRGSQLRRSFSRSPKMPQHSPPRMLQNSNAQALLGYDDETTMV